MWIVDVEDLVDPSPMEIVSGGSPDLSPRNDLQPDLDNSSPTATTVTVKSPPSHIAPPTVWMATLRPPIVWKAAPKKAPPKAPPPVHLYDLTSFTEMYLHGGSTIPNI